MGLIGLQIGEQVPFLCFRDLLFGNLEDIITTYNEK